MFFQKHSPVKSSKPLILGRCSGNVLCVTPSVVASGHFVTLLLCCFSPHHSVSTSAHNSIKAKMNSQLYPNP